MAGLDPRLSGSWFAWDEAALVGVAGFGGTWGEQGVKRAAVHEVGADQAREEERDLDRVLGGLGGAEQQAGEERGDELDADGVLGSAEDMADAQHLLDPAKEQLDGPTLLAEGGDLLGRSSKWAGAVRSLVRMRSTHPASVCTHTSRTRLLIGFWRRAA